MFSKVTNFAKRHMLRRDRLRAIPMLDLGSSVEDAIQLWGEPFSTMPFDELADTEKHTFVVGEFHDVVVKSWKGVIHSLFYYSEYSYPADDLECILRRYSEGVQWRSWSAGCSYWREDSKVWIYCSALPFIAVQTDDFIRALEATEANHESGSDTDG